MRASKLGSGPGLGGGAGSGSGGGAGNLSKLSILVAQLQSIVAAATHQQPEPLICFDLLVDLLSTIKQEPKAVIVPCQRQCEDAIQALLTLGVGPPVRRLAATAIVNLIEKGDTISIYSRTSSLQGWLSDKMDRKSDPSACIGVAQCLGALLRAFGQKMASGLIETNSIVAKLMRSSEMGVRQAALSLLQDALEGSGGGGTAAAYAESLRIITKHGVYDRSANVRVAGAGCLRAFAVVGGPGVGAAGIENCCSLCLKALEDPARAVRDSFAAALGALLALSLNSQEKQKEQEREREQEQEPPPTSSSGSNSRGLQQQQQQQSKPIDGGLQRHLFTPFVKASGPQYKEIRVSLMMALVAFLQGMRMNYSRSDLELQEFAMQAIGMLALSPDTHAQACLLFCLRVGFIEQMGESTQKNFTGHLIKQVSSTPDIKPAMFVVILRTLSHLLATLGEVSVASRDALDNSFVSLLANSSMVVRVEAALVLRTLAEVDATSASNLLSCGVTTLRALRETVGVERGDRLKVELDSLHGQAAMLAALLTASPRLVLGVPSRLPAAVWEVAKAMVMQKSGNPVTVGAENEAGWMLVASIVSSMPKEEIEEQKLDILILWTTEFGSNIEERMKRVQGMLSVHLSVWTAAVEALIALVKKFVVPSMSALNEGILLVPLISYLSRSLSYLSSSPFQQAPAELKPAIDLFIIKILRAFQAIPDTFAYQQDHPALLSLCSAPFIDPASYGASSCLRQLLDNRDSSLGPWIPGRDSFEDELRAFEGGADELAPCIWNYEVFAFPQHLPIATMLLDEMLLCFGTVFAAQREKRKLQFIQIVMEAGRAGKKQPWHNSNATNTCVALLRALKAWTSLRSQGSEVETMIQIQAILQGILSDDGVSSAERRAAAEGLGLLARLGSDSYAAHLTRTLLADARAPLNLPSRGAIALALGCVHQSVGGMALSALVPTTVQTLCALAKDLSDGFPVWSLHGLWLTADAAGLSYVPHVQATLSLVMELLLSGQHAGPALGQSIGRLINAVVAVLGPELSPGSSLFIRCKAVVAMIGTGDEPAALLECVLFTQQLVLFAPRAVPVHAHVKTLRPTLTSRQPSLRQAAVSTLHHLSERDAMAMCEEGIEQDLFAMLDKETDESIVHTVRSTLQRLFEEACPSLPSRWLYLCRNVVLSVSATKGAGAGFKNSDDDGHPDSAEADTLGDIDQGMITENTHVGPGRGRGDTDVKMKEADQLPRFKTRVFAAECLCRLPIVVGTDPTHFDLGRAKSLHGKKSGDWLVLHLGELVAVAYQVATGTMEIVKPMGIELLDVILEKFRETWDPMYEGHLLLEQYQAQLVSAARTALDPSASPQLVATGSKLVARIITSGIAAGDQVVLQRMVSLLTRHLMKWDDIVNPNYAEWVGCKVQVILLGAYACLKAYAFVAPKDAARRSPSDGRTINSLLGKHGSTLGRYWIALLRDFTALRLHEKAKLPSEYHPFLEGIQILTIGNAVEQYAAEVWLIVLEAVTVDARPPLPAVTESSSREGDGEEESQSTSTTSTTTTEGIELTADDFRQLWALSILMLSTVSDDISGEKKTIWTGIPSHSSRQLTDEPEVICWLGSLKALQCLCRDGFYSPEMMSLKICRELMEMLSTPRLHENSRVASAVLNVVDQIVKSAPPMYLDERDVSLQVIELCLHHVFQILARTTKGAGSSQDQIVDKSDEGLSTALRTLGGLVGHMNSSSQGLLLPHLLSAGVKLLSLVPINSVATSSLRFLLTSVISAIAKPQQDTAVGGEFDLTARSSILAAAVESMAQACTEHVGQSAAAGGAKEKQQQDEKDGSADPTSVKRVKIFLEVMMVMVSSMSVEAGSEEQGNFRSTARRSCISCLRSLLSSSSTDLQLVALQTLSTIASAGSADQPSGDGRTWAILLLREVGEDVMTIVYGLTQKPLTTVSAAAVAECLAVLILWHSIVEGDEAQQNVLHLLLPPMIGAATAENSESNVRDSTPLKTAVVKLVTRLASNPSSAGQFRAVMLELQPESRQQLQTIIKASIQQQPTATKTTLPSAASSPASILSTSAQGILPAPSLGKSFFPPPRSISQPVVAPVKVESAPPTVDDDGEDDWDDFQDNTDDFQDSVDKEEVATDQSTVAGPSSMPGEAVEKHGDTDSPSAAGLSASEKDDEDEFEDAVSPSGSAVLDTQAKDDLEESTAGESAVPEHVPARTEDHDEGEVSSVPAFAGPASGEVADVNEDSAAGSTVPETEQDVTDTPVKAPVVSEAGNSSLTTLASEPGVPEKDSGK